MCIGPEAGCHDVPDPIAPIGIRLCSLDPTRMLMSFADITISGPMFIEPVPDDMSMPLMPCALSRPACAVPGMFMLPMPPCVSAPAAGDGPACGVGLFIGIFMGIPLSVV